MKKFVLVPYNEYNKRVETVNVDPNRTATLKVLDEFDRALNDILNDRSRSSEERIKLYSQLFQRYSNIGNEYRNEPLPVTIKNTGSPPAVRPVSPLPSGYVTPATNVPYYQAPSLYESEMSFSLPPPFQQPSTSGYIPPPPPPAPSTWLKTPLKDPQALPTALKARHDALSSDSRSALLDEIVKGVQLKKTGSAKSLGLVKQKSNPRSALSKAIKKGVALKKTSSVHSEQPKNAPAKKTLQEALFEAVSKRRHSIIGLESEKDTSDSDNDQWGDGRKIKWRKY